ncbi:MAG: nucleotidyltransferase domain-containing protein [Dehalococcoidia bacterium]|nr:nucleotidyltransferase domain-containing protein [Dehalococcoidia bacterium]
MGENTIRVEIDPLARAFAEKVRRALKVETIIFFGSRVRGDYFDTSDYDFIIVSDDFHGVAFPLRPLKVYDFWDWELSLEALCYTPEEFRRKSQQTSIVSEALKEGLEL